MHQILVVCPRSAHSPSRCSAQSHDVARQESRCPDGCRSMPRSSPLVSAGDAPDRATGNLGPVSAPGCKRTQRHHKRRVLRITQDPGSALPEGVQKSSHNCFSRRRLGDGFCNNHDALPARLRPGQHAAAGRGAPARRVTGRRLRPHLRGQGIRQTRVPPCAGRPAGPGPARRHPSWCGVSTGSDGRCDT